VTVAGVLVLLVNDHLLKQAWPGFVTGKLSDVAGLVVAPALVSLLFWRRADLAATLLTGLLFTLVKTTETGADLASHAWTSLIGPSRVLADPTDLIALPALALAWWIRRRTMETDSRRWRILVTVPLAVLAVAATGADMPARSAVSVEENQEGRLVVHVSEGNPQMSENGGASWMDWISETKAKPAQTAQCVPGQTSRCYRVVPHRLAVEQSDDYGKTWQPSWTVSDDDYERLTRQYPEFDQPGLQSYALAVQARPGGHVVVVANGVDGILVRDVTGMWRRIGWPGSEQAAEVDLTPERNAALFLAACMLFGAVGAGLRQYQRVYTGFAAAACLGLFAAFTGGRDWMRMGEYVPYLGDGAGLSFFGLIAAMVGVLVCLALAFAGRARPAAVAVGVAGSPMIYAAVYTPFYGWSAGVPGPYGIAVAFAVALSALVAVAGAALIRGDARREPYLPGSSTSSPT
jgi:hypothetical protein